MTPQLNALIEQYAQKWNFPYDTPEERQLHRLALLRELSRAVHSQRSTLLAAGEGDEAANFRELELRINNLRFVSTLPDSLSQTLDLNPETVKERKLFLPEGLLESVPRDKFERYDREWESALASLANQAGWRFWYLTCWVEIARAEEFHKALAENLNPHGLVLFAESADGMDTKSPEIWHGRWLIALRPRFQTPDFRIQELPGARTEPNAPQWEHLFSAKSD